MRRWTVLLLPLLFGGCATEPPMVPPPPAPAAEPARVEAPRFESQPLKHLAGRDIAKLVGAIGNRPLSVKTRCSFRDEVTGSRGKLDLQVKDAEVKRFTAEIRIPKQGLCRFDMKEFSQVGRQPVQLDHGDGRCAVRMWEQGERVTVAFANCPAQCDGSAFDYVWPILVDRKAGRCV